MAPVSAYAVAIALPSPSDPPVTATIRLFELEVVASKCLGRSLPEEKETLNGRIVVAACGELRP